MHKVYQLFMLLCCVKVTVNCFMLIIVVMTIIRKKGFAKFFLGYSGLNSFEKLFFLSFCCVS